MKTIQLRNTLILILALAPSLLMAAWNPVRFDEYNYFTANFTPTPQTSFVSGINQTGTASFLMRTNDGGTTWDSISFSGSLSSVNIAKISFTDVNNGFAGGSNNNLQSLISTTDNGTTWIDITPDPTSTIFTNSISFINPQQGFVSGQTVLYKTFDGGLTWTNIPIAFEITSIHFTDMNTGYVCGTENNAAAVIKTTDGGQTWSTLLSVVNPFMFVNAMQKGEIINSNILFSSLQYSNQIYKTIDGGNTWDTITLAQIFSIQDYDFINANEGHVLSSMGELFRTIDGGLTWTLEYAVAGGVYGPSVFLTSISFAGTTGYVCGSSGLIKKYTVEVTGINESTNNININLYPNPVAKGNQLSITGISGTYEVEIHNIHGQSVLQQLESTDDIMFLNIADDLASGVYTINIRNNEMVVQRKFIVME